MIRVQSADDAIIVVRRVDVNKKPFRVIQIRDFGEVNPTCVNALQKVQRASPARLDQLGGPSRARVRPVESCERLRPSIRLHRNNSIMIAALRNETPKKFRSDEGKIAGDDDGPISAACGERGVQSAERSPLRVNVLDGGEFGSKGRIWTAADQPN